MIRRVPTLAPRWTRTTYFKAMGVQPQKGMVKIIGHTLPNNQPNERMNRNETTRDDDCDDENIIVIASS